MTAVYSKGNATFSCDHPDCKATAKSLDIMAQGGLTKAGWKRTWSHLENKYLHFCSKHKESE